ncbi:MAG TPA: polymer-forming cytoskeletal protein [Mucilaginibacter sp.]
MSLLTYTRKLFSKKAAKEPFRDELHLSGIFLHNDVVALTDVCVTQGVTGDIYCTKKITIHKNAQVVGNIYCRTGVVDGNVTGNIAAFEMLEIKANAVLDGNIDARKLNVSPAAILNGYVTSISLKEGRSIYSAIKLKIAQTKIPDMPEERIIPEMLNFDNFKSTVEEPNLSAEVPEYNLQPEKIEEVAAGDNNGKWW